MKPQGQPVYLTQDRGLLYMSWWRFAGVLFILSLFLCPLLWLVWLIT